MRLFIAVIAAVALLGVGSAMAVGLTHRTVAGMGAVTFSNEVQVDRISVVSTDQVDVIVSPNSAALPNTDYAVTLFLQGQEAGIAGVQWTAAEIPGTRKFVSFTGLDLTSVTFMLAEVTRP